MLWQCFWARHRAPTAVTLKLTAFSSRLHWNRIHAWVTCSAVCAASTASLLSHRPPLPPPGCSWSSALIQSVCSGASEWEIVFIKKSWLVQKTDYCVLLPVFHLKPPSCPLICLMDEDLSPLKTQRARSPHMHADPLISLSGPSGFLFLLPSLSSFTPFVFLPSSWKTTASTINPASRRCVFSSGPKLSLKVKWFISSCAFPPTLCQINFLLQLAEKWRQAFPPWRICRQVPSLSLLIPYIIPLKWLDSQWAGI